MEGSSVDCRGHEGVRPCEAVDPVASWRGADFHICSVEMWSPVGLVAAAVVGWRTGGWAGAEGEGLVSG